MLNKDFILELNNYVTDNSIFSQILSILNELLSNFKDIYVYNVEAEEKSVSIDIYNGSDYLFLDINNKTFNIRFAHSEFFFFNEEINIDELKLLLKDFFGGKYKIIRYFDNNLITKQELIFSNGYLIKYNQVDIYKNKKGVDSNEINGFNWFK